MACAYILVTLALCAAPGLGVLSLRSTLSLSAASLSPPDAEIRAASCITVGETALRTGTGDVDEEEPFCRPLTCGLSSAAAGRLSLTGCLVGDGLGFLATGGGGGGCTGATAGVAAKGLGAMPTVLVFFTGCTGTTSSSSSSLSVASLTTGSLSVSLSDEEAATTFLFS